MFFFIIPYRHGKRKKKYSPSSPFYDYRLAKAKLDGKLMIVFADRAERKFRVFHSWCQLVGIFPDRRRGHLSMTERVVYSPRPPNNVASEESLFSINLENLMPKIIARRAKRIRDKKSRDLMWRRLSLHNVVRWNFVNFRKVMRQKRRTPGALGF